MKYICNAILICLLLLILRCKFVEIDQPENVQPGEIIDISVTISDEIDETTNPHKGLLCILIPQDWSFISSKYTSTVGNGQMLLSPAFLIYVFHLV